VQVKALLRPALQRVRAQAQAVKTADNSSVPKQLRYLQ
jgi:hypothetical protein